MQVKPPLYRHHRGSGQALVCLNGRRIYLGKHGSAESKAKYRQLVAEWLVRGEAAAPTTSPTIDPTPISIAEISLAYWKHADAYYRDERGEPTGHHHQIRHALRRLNALYESTPAAEFGPLALAALQSALFSLRMSEVDYSKRAIFVQPEGTKTGMGQQIPLNDTAIRYLRKIDTERVYVFPWPFTAKKAFYWHWDKLKAEAAFPPECKIGLHNIRKTASTALWETSPQAAQALLGHTRPDTTANYYVEKSGMLRRAMDRLPQPSAFLEEGGK